MTKALFYYAVLVGTVLICCVICAVYFPRAFGDATPVQQQAAPAQENESVQAGRDAGDGGSADAGLQPAASVCVLLCGTNTSVTVAQEEFVAWAVMGELSPGFDGEALRATAVAARTYLLYHQAEERHAQAPQAQICTDSAHCLAAKTPEQAVQTWGEQKGTDFYRRVLQAVQATAGQVLTYDGNVIDAVFHAMSRGTTASAAQVWGREVPYLVSVTTPEQEDIPGFVSEREIAFSAWEEQFGTGALETFYDGAGRLERITVGEQTYSGTQVRAALSLRSTDVRVERDDAAGVYRLTVYGAGHGVGMSQWGARRLAEAGWDYRAILSHYYPGTALAVQP